MIKALITQKADLVCLQETKIKSMNIGIVRSLGVDRFLDWGAMDAEGAAGEILVFWDKRVLELIDMELGLFRFLVGSRTVLTVFSGCLLGFMALWWIVVGNPFRRNWVMLEVCGIFLGVWVETLMWFVSPGNVGKGEECLHL